jgi:hypothetical protein
MASFLDGLRNANVFGGGSNPFTPSEGNPFALLDQFMMRNPHLQDIGQQIIQPSQEQAQPPQQPMNTRFVSSEMTPYQEAQIGQKQAEMKSREGIASQGTGIKRDELGIKQGQLAINKFKSEHPGSKFMQGKDGVLRALDPITNQVTNLGITGMSDQDVIDANQENKLDLADVNNTAAMARTVQTGQNAIATKQTPSGTPFQPSQQKIDAQNKYNRFINSKEGRDLRKYVRLDADGMPEITPPSSTLGFATGPTQQQYDLIHSSIYSPVSTKTDIVPSKTIETAPTAPKGWKYVKKADGKGWTAVEDKGGK